MKQTLIEWLNDHPKMKKCLDGYDLTDITIIGGKFDETRGSSFFYDGVVYELILRDRLFSICASGEIRIHKDGELCYDTKERGDGFGFEVTNDEQLSKVNEENGFEWGMNNWFDFGLKRDDQECVDYPLGNVGYDLEEAFSSGIETLRDDDNWIMENEEMLNILLGIGFTIEEVADWVGDHFQNLLSLRENIENFSEWFFTDDKVINGFVVNYFTSDDKDLIEEDRHTTEEIFLTESQARDFAKANETIGIDKVEIRNAYVEVIKFQNVVLNYDDLGSTFSERESITDFKELEYSEVCEECKTKMDLQFRFTDWDNDSNDQYGTYDECVTMLKKAIQDEPEIRASVYDISQCPKCESSRDEGIIFNEKCPEYKTHGDN